MFLLRHLLMVPPPHPSLPYEDLRLACKKPAITALYHGHELFIANPTDLMLIEHDFEKVARNRVPTGS